MLFYNVTRNGRTMGHIEASPKSVIKHTTASYRWAIGKSVATLNEWLHSKGMELATVTNAKEIGAIRATLHPTKGLL